MKHANKVNMQFSYTPAASTNIARTIRREQQRLKAIRIAAEEAQKKTDEEAARVVTAMTKRART